MPIEARRTLPAGEQNDRPLSTWSRNPSKWNGIHFLLSLQIIFGSFCLSVGLYTFCKAANSFGESYGINSPYTFVDVILGSLIFVIGCVHTFIGVLELISL